LVCYQTEREILVTPTCLSANTATNIVTPTFLSANKYTNQCRNANIPVGSHSNITSLHFVTHCVRNKNRCFYQNIHGERNPPQTEFGFGGEKKEIQQSHRDDCSVSEQCDLQYIEAIEGYQQYQIRQQAKYQDKLCVLVSPERFTKKRFFDDSVFHEMMLFKFANENNLTHSL
jgi:hypothetical protein